MRQGKKGANLHLRWAGLPVALISLFFLFSFKTGAQRVETVPSPVFALSDLCREARYSFQIPVIDLEQGRVENGVYRYGVVRGGALVGQPPQISGLSVVLKGKNKAVATFEVSDPDGDLGTKSGVSILLFDKNLKGIASARNGSLLLFGDKSIFPKGLNFAGKTTGTFPFTLKGLKKLTEVSIWVSGIRDDAGNLALAPKAAGILGRAGTGPAPQILNANAALLQDDDVVGVNLDGTDANSDTVGMSLSFLDGEGEIVFALGILGEDGLENFAPFPLELVRNPVRGMSNFNINFSISGISKEVMPGTLKAVAVSLIDSSGNSSPVRVIELNK